LIRPVRARKVAAVYLGLSSRSATPSQDGRPREPRPTRDMGVQASEVEMPSSRLRRILHMINDPNPTQITRLRTRRRTKLP
jgi:hypothetical protein